MVNNIIVFTAALPLTLSLLAIAVSFVVLVNNASVVVSKIVDSGLSVLLHEARSSSSAYFVTCTFDDYHLPRDKSLSKKFHQTFMKNLRRDYGSGIRFLGCGEYGELHGRPIIITFCLILILMTKFFGSVQTVIILILLLVLPKYGNTVCILLVSLALILLPMSHAI